MCELSVALAKAPLIAILRGLKPERAIETAETLVEAGFRVIEVPLNSPSPLESIERIARRFGDTVLVGAGTVLSERDMYSVADAGGRVIVAPNMNPALGSAAVAKGLTWCPGVLTPSEAFAALEIGAGTLKLFPAEMIPPSAVTAMRAVLPKGAQLVAVGGITADRMTQYRRAGANAFGLGSALFKPEYSIEDVAQRAREFVDAALALER
ncbi:2-dehydro-3-deoxyphosphogalactonate aldolase [Aliiruegeria haliotis]|uniref:2-dehydro-3-deoxyphosphogalactonate aldolase n=1 Tax=Aliiruegeria haliotis TaxID=1280846 RepID=A0A2T0RGS7_9RHOB|nr:2-dehydro-3-deoxy-6-phosphogalactonate aldolase [Aliiruegeria haliotis]PRY20404.1 2-dehydro-3-deoxyphosphogalactonate aldolase [Aliiruegeria haliotis]